MKENQIATLNKHDVNTPATLANLTSITGWSRMLFFKCSWEAFISFIYGLKLQILTLMYLAFWVKIMLFIVKNCYQIHKTSHIQLSKDVWHFTFYQKLAPLRSASKKTIILDHPVVPGHKGCPILTHCPWAPCTRGVPNHVPTSQPGTSFISSASYPRLSLNCFSSSLSLLRHEEGLRGPLGWTVLDVQTLQASLVPPVVVDAVGLHEGEAAEQDGELRERRLVSQDEAQIIQASVV